MSNTSHRRRSPLFRADPVGKQAQEAGLEQSLYSESCPGQDGRRTAPLPQQRPCPAGLRTPGRGRQRPGRRGLPATAFSLGPEQDAASMSWDLLLSLLLACALAYLGVQLVRFVRADGDLTLMWAEWQGRRPEWELSDMVVWVTGASSGIGEELVYQLSKLGASLVLSSRRANELERVKNKCLEISNLKEKDILVLPLDLTDRSSHEAATKTVLQKFGQIDILVNNGGRSQRSLFVETNLDIYKEIMEINFLGTISLTKCVLPHMIERKQGKIVTVSSVMGITGAPLASGYSASKHALHGFFNSLRSELTTYPEITVMVICPGPVQSNIVHNAFTEEISKKIENPGEQDYKMATSRCVRLMLVSMANDLKEAWISEQPYLSFCYIGQYTPTWAWLLIDKLGPRRIDNFKSALVWSCVFFSIVLQNNIKNLLVHKFYYSHSCLSPEINLAI
uniref:Dehydrogenase/reductase 7 n=1 Tax=Sarcophilus harrisii TaxID=9305 RepID=A0A7N4V4F5_SARHA